MVKIWRNNEWVVIPSNNSIVTLTEEGFTILDKHEIAHHGSRFVFLGEISNHEGLCIVASIHTGRTFSLMKTEYFKEENV